MDGKILAVEAVKAEAATFTALADKIWALAELSLKEYRSAETYCDVLAKLGFAVEKNVAGLPTAFKGTYGQGKPVIAFLGEYDALSGLSQKAGATSRQAENEGGNGHGCGHNLLGAGALAAAYGYKEYLKASGKPGTVVFFGTPGEEGGSGKAYMAKLGIFNDVDVALTWHPSDVNEVSTGTCNSTIQMLYKFKGVSSHAAGDPENGRSALDAVELMNVGVQYLREHVKTDARIHYAMIDGGGFSPNVVQSEASVLYMTRSILVKDLNQLQKRVDAIAEGAAMMTGTTFEKIFIDGTSNTVTNHALEKIVYANLLDTELPTYTVEEWAYADALKKTVAVQKLPSIAAEADGEKAVEVAKRCDNGKRSINDFVAPLYQGPYFTPGSTDVGDVSWQTPAAQVYTTCFVSGSPGHSWQNVSAAKSSLGYKGMLLAAEVLVKTAVDLTENPSMLQTVRAEWAERTKDGFESPIPDGETVKAI